MELKAKRPLAAACLLAAAALSACGDGRHPSAATTTGRAAVSRLAAAARPRPRLLADYDDDDYLTGYDDEDPDDHHYPKDRDGDVDAQPAKGRFDSDDTDVSRFGRPATPAQRRAIVALAKRYYAAAARDDGTAICTMVDRQLARSYVQQFAEGGPHFLRGMRSCPQIAARFFAGGSAKLRAFASQLGIASVRVSGEVGLAVLGSRPFPLRLFEAIREGGRWYVYGSLDAELP